MLRQQSWTNVIQMDRWVEEELGNIFKKLKIYLHKTKNNTAKY